MGIMVMMAITACDPATMNPKDEPISLFTEVDEVTSFDLLGAPDTFDDASYAEEMRERPNPRHRENDGRSIGHHPFGKLLRALELNERQQAAAKEMLREHNDCVKSAIALYREHMKGLFMRARAARQEIIAAAKAGELTREEAREKIMALNKALRAHLKDSDIRARVKEMMNDCDARFLRSLHSILDEGQQATLKRWLMAKDARGDKDDARGDKDDARGDKDDRRGDTDDKRGDKDEDKDDEDDEKDDTRDGRGG